MQKKASDNSALALLNSLIDDINSYEKQANATSQPAVTKRAAVDGTGSGGYKTDPGSKGGPSSHPSAKADGNNHPASYGFRGKENSEDIKNDIPNSTDETSTDVNSGDSDHGHVNIGLRASATGEDPSVEDAYKGMKDDPGTSHPANAKEVGEKYSSMNFQTLYKTACHKIEHFLTRLGADHTFNGEKQAAAAQAGYALADMATNNLSQEDEAMMKLAAAQDLLAGIYKEACEDADLVGEYLHKLAAYQKQANDMMDPSAGGMPPEMGGQESPIGPEAHLPPEMGGGEPQHGAEPAGDVASEMGAGGGEGAGGDDAVNEMANALIEAGIPPEKLIAALEAAAAHEGGEPAAGGAEKGASQRLSMEDMNVLYKVAHDVSAFKDSGKFRRVPSQSLQSRKTAAERKEVLDYLGVVKEILSIR